MFIENNIYRGNEKFKAKLQKMNVHRNRRKILYEHRPSETWFPRYGLQKRKKCFKKMLTLSLNAGLCASDQRLPDVLKNSRCANCLCKFWTFVTSGRNSRLMDACREKNLQELNHGKQPQSDAAGESKVRRLSNSWWTF